MTSLNKITALAGFSIAMLTASAFGNPIQVAYSPVLTQPTSNGTTQVATWAADAIATFNTAQYAGYPLPSLGVEAFAVTQGGNDGPDGWNFGLGVDSKTLDLTGYTYIVVSWGGSNIPDDKGTADYLYYINGSGSWTFHNANASGDGAAALASGGLSGIRVYGGTSRVPDGGATVVLLGLGLVGMGFIARRRVAG
jgi:hypothetical protein